MNEFWLFLHYVGLILGMAPSVANVVIMRTAASAPQAETATLRRLPGQLAMMSAVGLLILWVTGPILVETRYGGFGALPATFWIKFLFVVALTVVVGLIHMTLAKIRRTGNTALGARLAILGPAAGLLALGAVLFAVIAFN